MPRKPHLNLHIFKYWSAELAYLLGWTITDGCIEKPPTSKRHVVSWELEDEEPLLIIRNLFQTDKKIESTKRGKYHRLRLCGKEVVEKFIFFGIEPQKTFKTSLPKMPDEYLSHFLRGVMDGDGTITIRASGGQNKVGYKRLSVEIASATEAFPKQIVEKLGYGYVLPNYGEDGHKACRAYFDCGQAFKFLTYVYENSEGLRLTRKWEKWQSFLLSGQTYRTCQLA